MSKRDFKAHKRTAILVPTGSSSPRAVKPVRNGRFQSKSQGADGGELLKQIKIAKARNAR